jgi:hypothetical protein
MPDFDRIHSRPYKPDPAMSCERCCFNSGVHADWCLKRVERPPEVSMETWQHLRTARPFEMVEVTPEELEFLVSSIYDKRT